MREAFNYHTVQLWPIFLSNWNWVFILLIGGGAGSLIKYGD